MSKMKLAEVKETLKMLGFCRFYISYDEIYGRKDIVVEEDDRSTGAEIEVHITGEDFLREGATQETIEPDSMTFKVMLEDFNSVSYFEIASKKHTFTATTTREDIISWLEQTYSQGEAYLQKLQAQLALAKMLKG